MADRHFEKIPNSQWDFIAFGTPVEIVTIFGGKSAYLVAIRELETALYNKAA